MLTHLTISRYTFWVYAWLCCGLESCLKLSRTKSTVLRIFWLSWKNCFEGNVRLGSIQWKWLMWISNSCLWYQIARSFFLDFQIHGCSINTILVLIKKILVVNNAVAVEMVKDKLWWLSLYVLHIYKLLFTVCLELDTFQFVNILQYKHKIWTCWLGLSALP